MTHVKYNFRQIKRTAVALLMIAAIAVLLFTVFCPSAGAVGLVDDSVDAAHEYSRYPLENYQLDFYVDNGWDWLPWNWIDGIGKQVMYGLYCITNFIWTINLYLSNASGYLVQEAYGLDFVSSAADEIGRNIQSIAGVSPSGLSADGFYAGFLLLIILIVGAYVAYVGLIKRETTKAVRAVMNMVLIFVLSGALIAYAPDCVKRLNEFSEDVSTASLSVGTKIVLPDADSSGGDSVSLIRDSLFSIQVKQPWLLLQFGDTDTDAVGEERIDNIRSASPSENNGEDREKAVKAEIEDNGNTNLTVTKTVNRLGTVFFLFLFNIGISVFVFLLTGMMIFSQVLFIIYAMFLPVSFVLSMVPTFEGSSRRAVIKLFNTILARAGITLVITVAFSISTMLYRIASGYPFFIIAFLQVVVFAGIYFKLGDLLSMFSLHDDGTRGMGRYILHRPRMFLHHELHRLNRTMRAAAANRPNSGGTQSNHSGNNTGSAGGTYRYRNTRPNSGSGGASQAGALHGLPEAPVRGLPSGGAESSTGAPPQGGNPPSHDGRYDAPAAVLPTQADKPNAETAKVSNTAYSRPATVSAQEETKRPITAAEQEETKQSAAPQAHERPVIAAGVPNTEKAQDVKPQQQPAPAGQGRPAAVDAAGTAQASGGTARKPATQPHERPAVAQTDAGERMKQPDRQNITAAKQPVHTENRRPDAVSRPAAMQNAADKPITSSTAAVQGKQDTARPAVKTVAPKTPEMKNQVSKPADKRAVQHKQAVMMRNKPDGTEHTGKAGGKQNGGGGR